MIACSNKASYQVPKKELNSKAVKISDAAIERTQHRISYNGTYYKIDYPNGDVPSHLGVCTDVVVRSYRKALGIDLQKEVHEDMVANFSKYPSEKLWGLKKADANIDHRRTQNLETFLTRKNANLKVTKNPKDYLPGDIVFWSGIGFGHVGIVVNQYTEDSIPMVVHNIGGGPKLEDFLFAAEIQGHYRWYGDSTPN